MPSARNENATGSTASCGIVKLVTSISPIVKAEPAANNSRGGV